MSDKSVYVGWSKVCELAYKGCGGAKDLESFKTRCVDGRSDGCYFKEMHLSVLDLAQLLAILTEV